MLQQQQWLTSHKTPHPAHPHTGPGDGKLQPHQQRQRHHPFGQRHRLAEQQRRQHRAQRHRHDQVKGVHLGQRALARPAQAANQKHIAQHPDDERAGQVFPAVVEEVLHGLLSRFATRSNTLPVLLHGGRKTTLGLCYRKKSCLVASKKCLQRLCRMR